MPKQWAFLFYGKDFRRLIFSKIVEILVIFTDHDYARKEIQGPEEEAGLLPLRQRGAEHYIGVIRDWGVWSTGYLFKGT